MLKYTFSYPHLFDLSKLKIIATTHNPIDLSKLSITTDPVSGNILDAKTKASTDQKVKQCTDIIQNTQNDLMVGSDGKLISGCENNSSCKACMYAINRSIADVRPADKGIVQGDSKLSAPSYYADDDVYDAYYFGSYIV